MSFRDVQILFAETLDQKQDRRSWVPAVITDEAGNQSGSGSVWFNQAERQVWCMPLGGTQPAPKFCPSGLEPVIGLGVILGYPEGSTEQQILRADDDFLQKSNVAPGSFTALTAADLGPGGKQFLWLQSKALMPLAVWPVSGLTIKINPGEYGYQGVRKNFGGITYNLVGSKPSTGQHRLVGLYLDSSNIFQVVNGTAVSTSTIPPAPAWPAGSFRLATVKLTGSSTSIDFVNDIADQRLLWQAADGGDGKVLNSATDEVADYLGQKLAVGDGLNIEIPVSGGDETLIITPWPADENWPGIAEIATQAEVDAATDDTRIVTPAKTATLLRRTSTYRPGVTRLYRNDSDVAHQLRMVWDGSRMALRAYASDAKADGSPDYATRVSYADVAASTPYADAAGLLGSYSPANLKAVGSSVIRTTNVTGIGSGWYTIPWTQYYNVSNMGGWSGGDPTKLFVSRSGYCVIVGMANVTPTANSDNVAVQILVNGSAQMINQQRRGSTTQSVHMNIALLWYCTVGDYIQLQAFNGSASWTIASSTNPYTFLGVFSLEQA